MARDPEKERLWRENNRERVNAGTRAWRAANRDIMRNGDYRRRYGITLAQFNSMVVTQGGVCAICETTKPGGRDGRFNVDHCHDTGAVRGLLCWNCNTALGKFKDDAGLLRKALAYLNLSTSETHPQPTPGMQ